jgi:hypothetical protein
MMRGPGCASGESGPSGGGGINALMSWCPKPATQTVPPDEAEYIHNEAKIALEQQSRARFNAVAGRRYYAALQFHDEAKVVVQNLTDARSASGRDLARYLVVVLSSLVDLNDATKSYIDADRKRSTPVFTEEGRSAIYYRLPIAKSQTVSLCNV